ncbi:MAG: 30S ribosomal protein S17 [Patescibacteria group bacterium]
MAKIFTGIVISTKMDKTVTVLVERTFRHREYQKVVTKNKKYLAHNDTLELILGDEVKIAETRPLSKNKHFKIVEKLTK